MLSHRQRAIGAALGFAALFAEPWIASTLGVGEEEAGTIFAALLTLIALAVGVDIAAVERRRRDPHRPALPDDYRQPLRPPGSHPPERSSGPPAIPPLLAIIVAGAALVAGQGCGPSALHAHTETLAVLVDTHAAAGRLHDAHYQAELDAAQTAEEVAAARDAAEPGAQGLDAGREALLGYAAALRIAVEGEDGWEPRAAAALARVLLAYDHVAAALRSRGIEAPPLPAMVAALAAGLAGGDR
jgi:hypothetical protein